MSIREWILAPETRTINADVFAAELARRVALEKISLDYLSFSVRTMHPELVAESVVWTRDEGAKIIRRSHAIQSTAAYINSPLPGIAQGQSGFRRKLTSTTVANDYLILQELFATGHNDYLIEALPLTLTLHGYVSWSTKYGDGFSDEQLSFLRSLSPYLSSTIAFMSQSKATEGLLDTYLGTHASRLVRSGQYRRGDGTTIDAVIWFSDMRGFTTYTETHSVGETLKRINHSFDVVGKSVNEHGGEILKFIGDAVLAVFPVTEDTDERAAASGALAAAKMAIQQLREEGEGAHEPLRIGIGINKGKVTFGNVGASSRLDFTVIGAPVNEASRVESLCKSLDEDVLLTASVAALLPEFSLRSVGYHNLRGVSASRELFAVPKS